MPSTSCITIHDSFCPSAGTSRTADLRAEAATLPEALDGDADVTQLVDLVTRATT